MYMSVGVCNFFFIIQKIFENNREESVSYVRGQRKKNITLHVSTFNYDWFW